MTYFRDVKDVRAPTFDPDEFVLRVVAVIILFVLTGGI